MHCSNIKIKKNLNRSNSKDNDFRLMNKKNRHGNAVHSPLKRFLIYPDMTCYSRDIIVQRKERLKIIYLKSD